MHVYWLSKLFNNPAPTESRPACIAAGRIRTDAIHRAPEDTGDERIMPGFANDAQLANGFVAVIRRHHIQGLLCTGAIRLGMVRESDLEIHTRSEIIEVGF